MPDYPSVVQLVHELISRRDPYNHHLSRTGKLAERMADAMELSPHEKEMFVIAANIHDIGKLLIRDDILNLPRALSNAEFAMVKQHSLLGYKIALTLQYDWIIKDVILHHHENYDGTGYPDRLAGAQISACARAMHVIDVWDAMNSRRPYRKAVEESEVTRQMLAEKGTSFDPFLLDLFFKKVYRHG